MQRAVTRTLRNSQNPTTLTTISSTPHDLSLYLAGDSVCLLKTTVATVSSSKVQVEANILFDEGSQRSFISQKLANSLQLHSCKKEDICLSSFELRTPTIKQLQTGEIHLITRTGNKLPLSVLIVLTIATPLQNVMQTHIAQLPHLQGISLAHPITRPATNFEISVDWCRSLLGLCWGSHHSRKWSHSNELKDRISTVRATIITTNLCIKHLKCYNSIPWWWLAEILGYWINRYVTCNREWQW